MYFKTLRRAAISVAAAASLAGGLALAAQPASADTTACANASTTHNGVTANWCASQELVALNLELAAPNKAVAFSRLTVKTTSTTNASEDWQFYPPAVTLDNAKVFEFSPHGIASGLCMAVSNNHALPVLKVCKSSSSSQQWVASEIGSTGTFEWASEATGRVVTDPGNGPAYTRLVLANPVGASGQAFTFTQ